MLCSTFLEGSKIPLFCTLIALPFFLFETAALQALKRKKRYEKQLAQIDGTLSTIEFQREALENAHTNTEVIKNMGLAAKAMKTAHDNMWGASLLLSVFPSLFVSASLRQGFRFIRS